MPIEPHKQHRWLEQFVGEWNVESEAAMEPGMPVEKFTGTEEVRSIGGLWIVCEGRGEMPGGMIGTTVMTLGYHPHEQRFVGTWIGSMMLYMWHYSGALDETERVLTLESEGPAMSSEGDMADGKLGKYRDVIELIDDDNRVMKSSTLGDNGEWQEFMTVRYQRVR